VLTTGRQQVRVGHLHRVVVSVDGRNGSLRLDDGGTVHASTTGALTSLNVQSTIYVGRVPAASDASAL